MRPRSKFLTGGVLLIVAISGFVAYKSSWVRSWFGRDAENAAELNRLADVKLDVPLPATADWPQWRGPSRDGRAPAGPLRTDWDKNPPQKL